MNNKAKKKKELTILLSLLADLVPDGNLVGGVKDPNFFVET